MVEPTLRSSRKGPECASEWLLARAVRGEADSSERARLQAALDACEHCRAGWDRVQSEQAAAQSERLPPALYALARPALSSRWRLPASLGSLGALAALLVLVARPSDRPTERLKGRDLVVTASVMRHGTVVRHDVTAETLGRLEPGDRVRLRLSPARGHAWAEGREGGRWVRYFEGDVPDDGWLPIGIVVTAGEASAVRVTSCPEAVAEAHSEQLPPNCLRRLVTF